MKISKQARREAKQLFRACLANGVLDESRARQIIGQLIAKKPRGYLAILTQFERLVKLEEERRTAKVESAAPLSADFQAAVQNSLTRHYGPGLRISFLHNPSLLGGLRVRVGSDVFDGTVQSRLRALQESF